MCYDSTMKVCTKCGVAKPVTEFFTRNKQTGRLHAQCKECYKRHRRSYYTNHYTKYKEAYLMRAKIRREALRSEFRQNMFEYLSKKACVECGERDIRVLELDHINPSNKKFSISQAVRLGYKWAEVLDEIKKCRVLCANCHKKHTTQQFGWYKSI